MENNDDNNNGLVPAILIAAILSVVVIIAIVWLCYVKKTGRGYCEMGVIRKISRPNMQPEHE